MRACPAFFLALLLPAAHLAADEAAVKSAIGKLNAQPSAIPTAATIRDASQRVDISLKADKHTYTEGEVMKLTLHTPIAGHVSIYYEDAAGHLVRLFPSDEITSQAAKLGAKVTTAVSAGANIISGEGSVTGVSIEISPPHFGHEKISAVLTDVQVANDVGILAALKKASTAEEASRAVAGAAIRQDAVSKSAIGRVNAQGLPTPLARIGLATVNLFTIKK